MNVNEMEPGRELDALIAEKVMGWRRVNDEDPYFWPSKEMCDRLKEQYPDVIGYDYFPAPLFSTDTAAAWEVVEHMINTPGPDGDYWDVILDITSMKTICVMGELADYRVQAESKSTPHAICLVALKAVTHED